MIKDLSEQIPGNTDHGLFLNNQLPLIPRIRKLFEHDPIEITVQKTFAEKLANLRMNSVSSFMPLPEEEQGENWLELLGIFEEGTQPILFGQDKQHPELSTTISRTNYPDVFLQRRIRMKKGATDVVIIKSLLIQKEQPTSIYGADVKK